MCVSVCVCLFVSVFLRILLLFGFILVWLFDFLFAFQREREGAEPDVWEGGEDLRGDEEGEMDQNVLYEKNYFQF